MIFNDFARAVVQIGDRRFQRVLLLGIGLSFVLLIAIYAVFVTAIGWFSASDGPCCFGFQRFVSGTSG